VGRQRAHAVRRVESLQVSFWDASRHLTSSLLLLQNEGRRQIMVRQSSPAESRVARQGRTLSDAESGYIFRT
jgi:hypothetical protein